MRQGQFNEALELSRKTWDMQYPMFGEKHADMALNLVWRAYIYKAMGHREDAVGCFQRAIEIYDELGIQNKKEETLIEMNKEMY